MVYLAFPGALAHDADDEAALRALDPAPTATARFRLRGLEGKLVPRPVVFANAPYSAWIPSNGARPLGVARAILAHVASGYIGALGPVDAEQAADFAEQVLRAAAEGEVRPAELLRTLRERAQRVYENRRLPHDRRRAALASFLYVYYGNPQVSIGPEAAGDG
jgi:hypothetical protein